MFFDSVTSNIRDDILPLKIVGWQSCILNHTIYKSDMAVYKNVKFQAEFILSAEFDNEENAIKNINAKNVVVEDVINIKQLQALIKKETTDETCRESVSVTESNK